MENAVENAVNAAVQATTVNLINAITTPDTKPDFDPEFEPDIDTEPGNSKMDPFVVLFKVIVCLFVFIYFANELVTQLIGFFIPIYHSTELLTHSDTAAYRSLIKYFYLYAHLEICSLVLNLIGIYAYHFKICIIFFLLYAMHYRTTWMNRIYMRVCSFDQTIVETCLVTTQRLREEYHRIYNDIRTKTQRKVHTE
jgi:hypothetical protein